MQVVALHRDSQVGWGLALRAMMTSTRVTYYSAMRL